MADGNAPKRVLLRKVLYRIDFQFITERMQENVYSYILEKYGEYFVNRGCEVTNSYDIEISAPEAPRMNPRPQNIYFLQKPKGKTGDGRNIRIGKTFVFFDIDLAIESENLPYYEWFSDIVKRLSEEKAFMPMRIGLRKYNTFFVETTKLEKALSLFAVPYFSVIEQDGLMLDNFHNVQRYNLENYSLNFTRDFSTGILSNATMRDQSVHQISFDFDLFSNENSEIEDFCAKAEEKLKEMNDRIYLVFSKFVAQEVCTKLNEGEMLEEYAVIPY